MPSHWSIWILALGLGYLFGSIPVGYLLVGWVRGVDVRTVGSGRTGGTNVMRAAGWPLALATGVGDVLKGGLPVLIAKWLNCPPLIHALTGVLAVVGHNYSLFLSFRGGAGTGTSIGSAMGLWPWSGLLTIPSLFGIIAITRRASMGSIALALAIPTVFVVRAALGLGPWAYVVHGIVTALLTLWSLRPNIQRLLHGEERKVDLVGEKTKHEKRYKYPRSSA
ncbi:MAG: glycerol-3-phosphate acyltransferase [Anaerolineae bacterium]|nr:glycerol-3-phosphate acyltransferase [Anaerolineae bacterium]